MKPDPRFSPARVEALLRQVPRGTIRIVPVEPVKGLELQPLSWADLGLVQRSEPHGERRVA